MAAKSRVLVTGATGAVGPELVKTLLERDYAVGVLSRRPTMIGILPPKVRVHTGDVTDPEAVTKAASGAEVIFHLAAKLHVVNASSELHAEHERVNVEGTRVAVEAARAAGVRRLVFFSTISVYGPTGVKPIDEDTPARPDSKYAETKLRAEEICLSAVNSSGRPLSTVLRMAAIYGPRVKGNYARLVSALERNRFVPVGRGTNVRTLIYDRDAIRAAILGAEHPRAGGRLYNVSDGSTHTLGEIVSAISDALGRRPPRLFIPIMAARLAASSADSALSLVGRRSHLLSAVDKYVETAAVCSERIQQELGFVPEYDLERGWRETVATLRGGKA